MHNIGAEGDKHKRDRDRDRRTIAEDKRTRRSVESRGKRGEGGERRAFSVTCRGGRKQAAGARSSARANGEEERLGSCQLAGACGGGGGDGVAARRGASKTHARTRRRRRDRTLLAIYLCCAEEKRVRQ